MNLEGSKQNRHTERGTRNAGRKRGLTPVMGQVMHERVVVFWVHSLGVGTMAQEHPDQGQLLGPETVTAIQCHRPTVRDEGTLWEQFLLTSPRLLAPKTWSLQPLGHGNKNTHKLPSISNRLQTLPPQLKSAPECWPKVKKDWFYLSGKMETKTVAILSPNHARYFTVSPTGWLSLLLAAG